MEMYFLAAAVMFIGTAASAAIREDWKMKACACFSALAAVLAAIPSFNVLLTGGELKSSINLPPVFNEVNFLIDPLSAFFILVISFMSFLGACYAAGYIKPYLNDEKILKQVQHDDKRLKKLRHPEFISGSQLEEILKQVQNDEKIKTDEMLKPLRNNLTFHCICFMVLILSMLMLVSVQNVLFFLVIWEIMSLSSFFLVIFEHNKKEVLDAGMKYMIYMHISVIFLIAAAAVMSIKSGSFNFTDISAFLKNNPEYIDIVFLLSALGFGIKAGFMPFHNWLPAAHPAAPSHISGVMSGVMIKMGIYGILRMIYLSGGVSKTAAYALLAVSVISAFWGVLYAISRHDIKQLLACHSIENIGIIGIGIAIGLLGNIYHNPFMAALGFSGAVLHVLNHSIFKELLFFAAGSIYKKTHTRNIEKLGGLIKKMPYTSLFFITGSIAISGLPPFNGFISEFLIYAAMVSGLGIKNPAVFSVLIISLAALAFIGTMAVLCFTKVTGVMLLGSPRSSEAENVQSDNEGVMIIPMGILAVLTLIIGLFPENAVMLVLSPVSMFVKIPEALNSVINLTASISILFFIFLIVLAAVSLLRLILKRKSTVHNTWGCGYNGITPKMQYTASSYADLFVSAMKPFFKKVEHVKKPKEIFPSEAYYESEIEDIEEAYIVKPLIKLDEEFLSKFERLQDGNIQHYILFGLIFLLLSIAGLFLI